MGSIYLFTLIFLIIRFRKKILFTQNNYLLLIFLLFFSYLIPLMYGLIKVPVLTDRYIIFVLIPIIIIISSLIFEIFNPKLKFFLIILIVTSTLINNYIEIQYRKNTKPEFTKLLTNIEKHEIKKLTLFAPESISNVIKNYLLSLKNINKNNLKIFDIDDIPADVKSLWVICYEPVVGYDCSLKKDWTLKETKRFYLLKAQLYNISN